MFARVLDALLYDDYMLLRAVFKMLAWILDQPMLPMQLSYFSKWLYSVQSSHIVYQYNDLPFQNDLPWSKGSVLVVAVVLDSQIFEFSRKMSEEDTSIKSIKKW